MQVVIADYGKGHALRNKAEAEAYAAHYTPGSRLYVPYRGKTPRGMLGIYGVQIVSVRIEEDKKQPGTGKITAECSDRKPYTRKAVGDATKRT